MFSSKRLVKESEETIKSSIKENKSWVRKGLKIKKQTYREIKKQTNWWLMLPFHPKVFFKEKFFKWRGAILKLCFLQKEIVKASHCKVKQYYFQKVLLKENQCKLSSTQD